MDAFIGSHEFNQSEIDIQVWSKEPFLVIECLQMKLFFWISWNGAYYGAYSSNHPHCAFVLLYLTVVKFDVLKIFRVFEKFLIPL